MQMDIKNISYDQLEIFAEILNQCTENFVFIFDVKNDKYYISELALKIFDLPAKRFDNALETLNKVVHQDDREMIKKEFGLIKMGKKDSHNLEYRWVNKHGKPIWISCRGKIMYTEENENPVLLGCIAIIEDVDKEDLLTSLPTESQLRKDFSAVWKRQQKVSGYIFRIDVDNLGHINEQYGTHTGDFVLSLVSDCVKRSCEDLAVPYKMNSDEIVCMNLSGGTALDANRIYQNLKRNIAEVEQKIDYDVVFTVSAGVVAFFNDRSQLEELLRKAHYSLTTAKHNGKNNLILFNASDYSKHLRSLDLQEKIRESIKNNFYGFELYYQPVVNAKEIYLDSDNMVFNVIGAEALLRWSCSEYGQLSPDEFIPILEETGLIIPVGRWILLTAFNQCKEWNKVQKGFRMSVNLSYIQVKKSDILADVQMSLHKSGVNPENITLELTESGYMDSSIELQNLVASFRKLGLKVDIDDFGTGYSNLRYLQYLQASTLKLDYSFVHKATGGDEGDGKVIKHITQMAHELNMAVCMEGIESSEDIAKLAQYEPDKFQGYFFGRPLTAVQFREHSLRPDSQAEFYRIKKQNKKQ